MIQLLVLPIVACSMLILSSCGCCTGEEPAPKLRSLPAFNPVPGADPAPVQAPEDPESQQFADPVEADYAK